MKRVNTSDLVPGMVTAEDVYNFNNQLILPRGIILTDSTITKLAFYSVLTLYVEDQLVVQSTQTDDYTTSYTDRLKRSPEFTRFHKEFENDVDSFRGAMNDVIEKGSPLDVNKLMNHTLNILDLAATTPNVFDMLHCMREYDDETYVHSMNVALICNIFARWLRMSEEEIAKATTSGLLHDIGKIKIPDSILKKPDKLTKQEFNIIKRHPQEGYRLLLDSKLDEDVLNAVLMHHERCDGSGYPTGLTEDYIDNFAMIVAIADVYDAMTAARSYRSPLCPFEVISKFEEDGFQKYHTKYILVFLKQIASTYQSNRVILSDGRGCTIVMLNQNALSRPIVQFDDKSCLDLSTASRDLYIKAVL